MALPDNAVEVVDLLKKRVTLLTDFELELKTFVEDPSYFDISSALKVLSSISIVDLSLIKDNIEMSGIHSIKENLYRVSQENNLNFGKLLQFIRLSLVGDLSGPDVFFIIKMIGKNVTLRRLNLLLEKIKKQ